MKDKRLSLHRNVQTLKSRMHELDTVYRKMYPDLFK
jgi:hypothetical protein